MKMWPQGTAPSRTGLWDHRSVKLQEPQMYPWLENRLFSPESATTPALPRMGLSGETMGHGRLELDVSEDVLLEIGSLHH